MAVFSRGHKVWAEKKLWVAAALLFYLEWTEMVGSGWLTE